MKCRTVICAGVATVPGVFGASSVPTSYCQDCARFLWLDGSFKPDDEACLHAPQDLDDAQAKRLRRFEESPPAPESFDARAAVRRVQTLVQTWIDEADAYDQTATEFVRKARVIRARAREVHRAIEGGDGA